MTMPYMDNNGHQIGLPDQASRSVSTSSYGNKVRVVHLGDEYEVPFFADGKNQWQIKSCLVNGVPKVGLTKFFFAQTRNMYLPDKACYMTVPAWRALFGNTKLLDEINKRSNDLQTKRMLPL